MTFYDFLLTVKTYFIPIFKLEIITKPLFMN
ncbi:hypothetical protein SAMN05444380_10462 [Thermophagus xiamenensis]|uniref:Uncharacterized protein n=1 Tax=Thermophagus xiamenensis TaxID=385682 RepID=A0A1I1WDY9_9BACT|nr:hypothetical protein SAMN05444380_10462 [Thermophagus xiamenensis]